MLKDQLPDPMQRINMLRKMEKRENRRQNHQPSPSTMSKVEAEKCDISLKWMHQFEEMHQERMKIIAATQLLEADVMRKDEQIRYLSADLKKINTNVSEKQSLLREQQKTIRRQQNLIKQQQIVIQQQQNEAKNLRALIWRLKRTNRMQKKEQIGTPKPEIKCESMPEIKCVLLKNNYKQNVENLFF